MSPEIVSCFSCFCRNEGSFFILEVQSLQVSMIASHALSSFILFSSLAQKANSLPNQMCKPPTQNLGEKYIPFNTGKPFQRLAAVYGFTSLWGVPNVTTTEFRTASLGLNKVTDMEKQLLLPQITYNLIIKTTVRTINK